jgi:hypothetical protein
MQKAFSAMSGRQIREFNRVVDSLDFQTPTELPGARYKIMDSDLGTHAERYAKSTLASDKQIGRALKDYQSTVRERLFMEAPSDSAGVRAADSAWNQLKGIKKASDRAAVNGGIFTPGQLVNAVKGTRGAGASAQLRRAQQAQRVFGDTYPDSGTAGRLIQNIAAGGAGIGGVTGLIDPGTALGIGGAALVYHPSVQQLIVKYMQQGNSLVDAIKKATAASVGNTVRK